MNEKQTHKPRPYWHVDMKWVGGIGLFFALSATLLLFNLSSLTERDKAVNISATIVANLFSKDGLGDDKSLNQLKQNAALLPGDAIAPIQQFPSITISKADLASLSPSDLRLAIFRQITGPIYDKGLDGAAASFASSPTDQETFKQQAAPLNVFTNATHQLLHTAFIVALVISVFAAAELVFFSAGWGRLASPGVVLLLGSPIGVAISLLLLHPPTDGSSPLAQLPSSVTQAVGNTMSQSYLVAATLGAVLLFAALVGKIVQTIIMRSKSRSATKV